MFFIASDDNGQLYLSSDDTAANAVLIATEPNWGNAREWTGEAGGGGRCDAGPCLNISVPIQLEAGKRYYTEVLHKEGGGGDHAAVAWKLDTAPDPENGAPPIWSDVLSTVVAKAILPDLALPTALASPIGSGDASKPGFNARIFQANQEGGTVSVNEISRAEQELLGLLGPNVADLNGAVGGVFSVPSTINWNADGGDIGSIPGDQPIPGIPGTGSNADRTTDNIAAEIITYAEFPSAGVYMMGVNSDDGFKVTATDKAPTNIRAVRIHAPSAAAGQYYAADGSTVYGGAFKPFAGPVTGKLVVADPPDACSALKNGPALAGNIAVVRRGVCTFSIKVQACLSAGAIAVIVVNSRDPGSADGIWPIVMGGAYVDGNAFMITKPDGNKIIDAINAGETVNADITADETPALGQFDGGRGATDSIFSFYVAQPGVYPLRLVWFEGDGGANVEWFSFDTSGNKTLLNSTAPGSIKTYRARTYVPVTKPALAIGKAGDALVITFEGTLQSATTPVGPYSDMTGTTSPYTNTPTAQPMFYRSKK